MNDVQEQVAVSFSPEFIAMQQITQAQKDMKLMRLENEKLRAQLEYERGLREEAEALGYVAPKPPEKKRKRKRREVIITDNMYNEFKSNGIRKARAAESIRSYDDFKKMQDYFLSNGKIRDWCMWTMGVGLGLRISDLLSLQFKNVINPDNSIKKRIQIYEKKTGKLNNILITEAVQMALERYLSSIKWQFDSDYFIFSSRKGGGKYPMAPEYGWRIISNAGKACKLPVNIGSHTMRKSFANIAACCDKSSIDMNAITKVQGLLNHSDQRVTMKYLGSFQDMYDRARVAVSDFILGRTNVNEIIAGNQYTLDDIFDKVDALEKTLIDGR